MSERVIRGEQEASAVQPPVRLLIVAPSLDILGGQAVQATRLLKPLMLDSRLSVSFLPINPRLPRGLRWLQSIKYVRTIVTLPVYIATLFLQVRRYDVIHIFSASYLSFVLAPAVALAVARFYGKKTVLNYHSGEADDHLARWRRTTGRALALADAIVVPSSYLVKIFARYGFRARSIFNTVEQDRFRFRLRNPLRPVFLSNRNLEPHYDVASILRAFAIIQAGFPDARLTVAGDGSQRAELEKLAQSLNLRNTEFVGRVPHERINELYDQTDIYLNSSTVDNMPCSIIESFAAGLPVVTTNAGGIPHLVTDGETGFLVKRGDFRALANSAIRLLEDKALATRIAHNAYAQCDKYTWEAVGDEWVKLYYELAGLNASSQPNPLAEARASALEH